MRIFTQYLFLLVVATSVIFQPMKFNYMVYEYINHNQAFTEKYCENKDKPELNCNGTCEIKKELSDVEKKSPLQSNTIQKPIVEILFIEKIAIFDFTTLIFSYQKRIFTHYSNLYFFQNNDNFFHPPQSFYCLKDSLE